MPTERGWFGSAKLGDVDVSGIMLWGGLNGKNEREDDGWILPISRACQREMIAIEYI